MKIKNVNRYSPSCRGANVNMGEPGSPTPPPAGGFGRGQPSQEEPFFIPSVCGAAVWRAEVTIVRRVQPPSQPPPAGGRLGGGLNPAHDGHRSRPCGCAAPRRDEKRFFLEGRSPPKPSQGPGPGCAGLRHASAGAWGNPVSSHPSSRAYVHVSPTEPGTAQDGTSHRASRGCRRPLRGDGHTAKRCLTLREPGDL